MSQIKFAESNRWEHKECQSVCWQDWYHTTCRAHLTLWHIASVYLSQTHTHPNDRNTVQAVRNPPGVGTNSIIPDSARLLLHLTVCLCVCTSFCSEVTTFHGFAYTGVHKHTNVKTSKWLTGPIWRLSFFHLNATWTECALHSQCETMKTAAVPAVLTATDGVFPQVVRRRAKSERCLLQQPSHLFMLYFFM